MPKVRVLWISLFVIVLFAGLSVTKRNRETKTLMSFAITNLENDESKPIWPAPRLYQRSWNRELEPGR